MPVTNNENAMVTPQHARTTKHSDTVYYSKGKALRSQDQEGVRITPASSRPLSDNDSVGNVPLLDELNQATEKEPSEVKRASVAVNGVPKSFYESSSEEPSSVETSRSSAYMSKRSDSELLFNDMEDESKSDVSSRTSDELADEVFALEQSKLAPLIHKLEMDINFPPAGAQENIIRSYALEYVDTTRCCGQEVANFAEWFDNIRSECGDRFTSDAAGVDVQREAFKMERYLDALLGKEISDEVHKAYQQKYPDVQDAVPVLTADELRKEKKQAEEYIVDKFLPGAIATIMEKPSDEPDKREIVAGLLVPRVKESVGVDYDLQQLLSSKYRENIITNVGKSHILKDIAMLAHEICGGKVTEEQITDVLQRSESIMGMDLATLNEQQSSVAMALGRRSDDIAKYGRRGTVSINFTPRSEAECELNDEIYKQIVALKRANDLPVGRAYDHVYAKNIVRKTDELMEGLGTSTKDKSKKAEIEDYITDALTNKKIDLREIDTVFKALDTAIKGVLMDAKKGKSWFGSYKLNALQMTSAIGKAIDSASKEKEITKTWKEHGVNFQDSVERSKVAGAALSR